MRLRSILPKCAASSVEAAAPKFAVQAETILVHGSAEIEGIMAKLAGAPGGNALSLRDLSDQPYVDRLSCEVRVLSN